MTGDSQRSEWQFRFGGDRIDSRYASRALPARSRPRRSSPSTTSRWARWRAGSSTICDRRRNYRQWQFTVDPDCESRRRRQQSRGWVLDPPATPASRLCVTLHQPGGWRKIWSQRSRVPRSLRPILWGARRATGQRESRRRDSRTSPRAGLKIDNWTPATIASPIHKFSWISRARSR